MRLLFAGLEFSSNVWFLSHNFVLRYARKLIEVSNSAFYLNRITAGRPVVTSNFLREGQRTTAIETDLIVKMTKEEVALSRHYALFHGNVNKPPIHEAYIVTFV